MVNKYENKSAQLELDVVNDLMFQFSSFWVFLWWMFHEIFKTHENLWKAGLNKTFWNLLKLVEENREKHTAMLWIKHGLVMINPKKTGNSPNWEAHSSKFAFSWSQQSCLARPTNISGHQLFATSLQDVTEELTETDEAQ